MTRIFIPVFVFLTDCFNLVHAQNVGIGVTNPQQKLHVGGSIRADGLASAGTAMITTNTNGDLLRTNFSGNVNDVLRGNGTFGAVPTLPAGAIIASTLSNDQNLLTADYSFFGELSTPAITYFPVEAGLSQPFTQAPVYETGDVLKTPAPVARAGHAAVWTGTEMIIWGGQTVNNNLQYFFYNNGSRYNPLTDSWTNMSSVNAPVKSAFHSSVWTGTELLVWGGQDSLSNNFFGNQSFFFHSTGKRYNPTTNAWTNMNTTGAPSARYKAPSVWTGTTMVVWGGSDGINAISDGARYNAAANTWSAISTANAPVADANNTKMFWTGTYAIVLGYRDTVTRYNPATNTWLISPKCPAGISYNKDAAIWTGTELWVYQASSKILYKYNPATNIWTNITVVGSQFPSATSFQCTASLWTDTQVLLFGNVLDNNSVFSHNLYFVFDPGTNTFNNNAIIQYNEGVSSGASLIKAGSILIKWGGYLFAQDFEKPNIRFTRQGTRIYLSSGIFIPPVYIWSIFDNRLYLYKKN